MKEIKDISDFIMQSQGFDISSYEDSFLKKTLHKRISESKSNSIEEYSTFLKQSSTEGNLLIASLQNNYSEFFRNALTFAVLERIVLPSLVQKKKKKEIRIWSAACAQGQEVYSIAILLEELRNGGNEKFNYRIFATDKCDAQINKARIGQYPSSALNNVNFKRAKKWFTKQKDTFTIKPELKENIDFSVFDLLDKKISSPSASIFGDFDIVICANLLFYFTPKKRRQILDKVSKTVSNSGYLITGEAEREILLYVDFKEIFPQSGIFQKKMDRACLC
ncbi:MAG: protein-glutamate O-methyltransferase CheR [Ignavibacteriales bacterium]|nr:protein-glutamate O-methyltransferase CheR [Ignavibacteriales bacterium]MCF8306508.1 protein-glutamate O-methyltransferase CheR [Ignavibacteriales bacterium]MCF8316307.1 protein-glutamate O-methyltransferase CheR [Ignavibacteriales bacterium]MCF8437735.1 protein-glutamate O-methyltransferase CheR [Ignavibacteriales bacterium]